MAKNNAKKIFNKIISYLGIIFFVVAAGMLWWQLRDYSLMDILRAVYKIPVLNLIAAGVASILGYMALSCYDWLALRYVGRKLSWWKWMLAGIMGFAISNNAGHAVITGGAIRYRLYTRWRIRTGEIIKMLTFSGFTYFLGCTAIVVIGYFLVPRELFNESLGASIGVNLLFGFCISALIIYFGITSLFGNKIVKIGKFWFQIPTAKTALMQMGLGTIDSILASLVLYFCITPFVDIPFAVFMGVFVIAQTAGVFSQVPGGIGIFESVFLVVLPADTNLAQIFGALMAFRVIYYLLPLIGAGGLFVIYENYLRARLKKWRAQMAHILPHKK